MDMYPLLRILPMHSHSCLESALRNLCRIHMSCWIRCESPPSVLPLFGECLATQWSFEFQTQTSPHERERLVQKHLGDEFDPQAPTICAFPYFFMASGVSLKNLRHTRTSPVRLAFRVPKMPFQTPAQCQE